MRPYQAERHNKVFLRSARSFFVHLPSSAWRFALTPASSLSDDTLLPLTAGTYSLPDCVVDFNSYVGDGYCGE